MKVLFQISAVHRVEMQHNLVGAAKLCITAFGAFSVIKMVHKSVPASTLQQSNVLMWHNSGFTAATDVKVKLSQSRSRSISCTNFLCQHLCFLLRDKILPGGERRACDWLKHELVTVSGSHWIYEYPDFWISIWISGTESL